MSRFPWPVLLALLAGASATSARAATTDDLVFIHHSCGENWLDNSLDAALVAKDYIDERNDITYGTDLPPDPGRPDSLASVPGDLTDMCHWLRWFNDYLGRVKAHGCADGVNRIIMFKSCFPNSDIHSDGTEPGEPFNSDRTLANYKAVFRHPNGPGNSYDDGGTTYEPLGDIFAQNPDTLFIFVTAPPLRYADTNDANAHRARLFNNWAKGEWLASYNAAHPGLNNVAVFDWFDVLAYPDDHGSHPNRLKAEYGGATGDSHPNDAANAYSTEVFATGPGNFIDAAWGAFIATPPPSEYTLTVTIAPPEAEAAGCTATADPPGPSYPPGQHVELTAHAVTGWEFSQWSDGDTDPVRTIVMAGTVDLAAQFQAVPAIEVQSGDDLDFGAVCVGDVAEARDAYTVSNAGAAATDVTVAVEAPFQVFVDEEAPADSSSFTLGPGEEKKLSFTFAPFRARRATEPIFITSTGGNDSRVATGLGVLPVVAIAATDPAASETGPDTGDFTVTRSGGLGLPLTVRYSVGGTAKNGTDYERLPGAVEIPEGELSATILVAPIDDARVEPAERVVLTLRSSSAYTADREQRAATVAIEDNEPTLSIEATDPEATEEGPKSGLFTITRADGSLAPELAVRYSVKGTAKNGTDYVRLSGEVTILAGEPSATILVTPLDDERCERTETVVLTLRKSTSYLIDPARKSATVSITDNEPTVSILATAPEAAEEGPENGEFTVLRAGRLDQAITVFYSVSGQARKGGDYERLPGFVELPAGVAAVAIPVVPIDDAVVEMDETVVVSLRSNRSYTVDTQQRSATVTIADNDPAVKPKVTVAATQPTVPEEGPGQGEFTVTRTGDLGSPLAVRWTVTGKARNGSDYEKLSGTLLIPAGEGSLVVPVIPRDDSRRELDETVTVALARSKEYSIDPTQASATVTIEDDD